MSEQEPEKIKVVDKRRFGSTGEKQGDSDESGFKETPTIEKATQAEAKSSEKDQQAPQLDFSSFAMSLATQTMMMLGQIPHPETGELTVHIEAARQTIDILGMLQEKTEGNLSNEESTLSTEILSSLRMAFVNIKKAQDVSSAS